jgi:hypothetical protein
VRSGGQWRSIVAQLGISIRGHFFTTTLLFIDPRTWLDHENRRQSAMRVVLGVLVVGLHDAGPGLQSRRAYLVCGGKVLEANGDVGGSWLVGSDGAILLCDANGNCMVSCVPGLTASPPQPGASG